MLHQAKVDLIRELLDGNLSQRLVAKRVGAARETVRRIASGERGNSAQQTGEPLMLFDGEPGRCPSCGGMVYMPCLACRLREHDVSLNVDAPSLVSRMFGKEDQSSGNI